MVLHILLCVVLVLGASMGATELANGDSEGVNAYTFFILKTLDKNTVLRDSFYSSRDEVSLRLFSHSFDVLTDNHTKTSGSVGAPVLEQHSNFFQKVPYYDLDLSNEWVLLEKPLHGRPSTLLHCRLPLHLNATTVVARREQFIRKNEAKTQQRLLDFWSGLASSSNGANCRYGEGDNLGKGTEEYYVMCPHGKMLHVRRNVLASILTDDKSYVLGSKLPQDKKAKKQYKTQQEKMHNRILNVLKAMSTSPSRMEQYVTEKPFKDAFEVIGEYHAALVPQWNRKSEAWELVFPSRTRCERPVRFSPKGQHGGEAQTWTTTVVLRCASSMINEDYKMQPAGQKQDNILYWLWTEVLSLCTFRLEVSCSAVCEWEHHMENLRTTPIPCAVLN